MSEVPQCYVCEHYKGAYRCDAFGDDPISDEILFNQFDHTKPYKGDNGIRMTPVVAGYEFDSESIEGIS